MRALTLSLLAACCACATNRAEQGGGVAYFDRQTVESAFAVGKPLIERQDFKIHASRRTGAGRAEVHHDDTDIVYVLQGNATIVTGGDVVGVETIGAGEQRGERIDGGVARRLEPGDVMVIPAGVPHWFREVSPPFLYYVVKTD